MNSHPKNCISHCIKDLFDLINNSRILDGFYQQADILAAFLQRDVFLGNFCSALKIEDGIFSVT